VAAAKNQCAGAFGRLYDFYIERPRLARLIGRAIWGIEVGPMYASMSAIGRAEPGATIVDVPCGGGVALRALAPGQDVRYLAIDISAEMVARVNAKARALGLTQVQTLQADMRELPLADASADLLCSYSGLHMIADPQTAIAEFARVLEHGGTMIGSTFVASGTRRKRALFEAGERRGYAMPPSDAATVAGWLRDAGLTDVEISGEGFTLFRARRGGRQA
jgi:ubiquinone/menaquinone biosynthesis C-methylase UbiE